MTQQGAQFKGVISNVQVTPGDNDVAIPALDVMPAHVSGHITEGGVFEASDKVLRACSRNNPPETDRILTDHRTVARLSLSNPYTQ